MDQNLNSPKISVILPVYNAAQHLREAIDSVLSQTFTDFELIIINDGSTDRSDEIINSFSDSRIVRINHASNRGLIATLNEGLDLARGECIARMDADDLCLPDRFKEQLIWLETHSDTAVLGTFFYQFDGRKRRLIVLPETQDEVRAEMVFRCPLAHPTVMMRASVIRSESYRYDTDFMHAEDFELWSRIGKRYPIANLAIPLLKYRIHPAQVSNRFAEIKNENRRRIMLRELKELGVENPGARVDLHDRLARGDSMCDINGLQEAELWLKELLKANAKSGVIEQRAFQRTVCKVWIRAISNSGAGVKAWRKFRSSEIIRGQRVNNLELFTMWAKLILRYQPNRS